jgi:iron-sulfur cluster assembly accessory protein
MIPLTVNDEAKAYIIAMLEKQNVNSVKLSLAPQGCNGYKYDWKPTAETQADFVIELGQGYTVIYNKDIVPYILNSQVVIETVGLGKKLSITNPNVAGSCGCGESVNFDV